MRLQNTYISLLLFFFLSLPVFAQREGEIDYEKEFIGGVNFNTNGGLIGGFMLRYTTLVRESNKQFHNFGLGLDILKHPKEIRYASQQSGGSFVAYKANHLVVVRPTYGREFVLFHKGNEDGVQLDFILNGGISFGILTPYYIEYQTGPGVTTIEPYDPVKTPDVNLVINSQSYTTGFSHSKVVPGIHLKTGFSFEYGHFSNKVTGLEAGFLFEGFTRKMVMMEAPAYTGGSFHNNQFFSSIYLVIFYGGRK
jgi:hypothetical protein